MEKYQFSFDSEESKEIFQKTIQASKKYELVCTELIEGFKKLEKIALDKLSEENLEDSLLIYWNEETLLHVKKPGAKPLKLANATAFSKLTVDATYLPDLLNTINLTLKPLFLTDLKGLIEEQFLHIQNLDLIAEGLDIPNEEALEFCLDMNIEIIETKAGSKFVNLGDFVSNLLQCTN